jgi:hypothetical protein
MDKLFAQIYAAKTDYHFIAVIYHKKKLPAKLQVAFQFLFVLMLFMQYDSIYICFFILCNYDIANG